MNDVSSPVAVLSITQSNGRSSTERTEPVYGGYSNPRGEIFLFAKELVFRVNLKTSVLQQRAPLNPGAQARYDATVAGDDFDYGNRTFRRLSHEIIADICGAHRFRLSAGGHYS